MTKQPARARAAEWDIFGGHLRHDDVTSHQDVHLVFDLLLWFLQKMVFWLKFEMIISELSLKAEKCVQEKIIQSVENDLENDPDWTWQGRNSVKPLSPAYICYVFFFFFGFSFFHLYV